MKEIWKDVKGYECLYQVSNFGNVKSLIRNKILILSYSHNGYRLVSLQRKTFRVHRLVAEHFIPNPNNYPCVNHIDSNRKNNDVSNLEFCTHKQNIQWALKTGRFDDMKKLNSKRMKEREVWKGRWCKNA